MMKTEVEIPPSVQLSLDEELWKNPSPEALKDALMRRGLERDFSEQSEWSLQRFPYADKGDSQLTPGNFNVVPSGSLNPFSKVGKCMGEDCSTLATNDFIRTIGLYADTAVIPDPITNYFLNDSLSSPWGYIDLLRNLKSLQQLAPLIKSKVVRFSQPRHGYCADCYSRTQKVVRDLTESQLSSIVHVKVELGKWQRNPILLFSVPVLQAEHSHPLKMVVAITDKEATMLDRSFKSKKPRSKYVKALIRKKLAKALSSEVDSCFFDLESARAAHSVLLAGSRAEVLTISALEREPAQIAGLEDWESLRNVNLPWVNDLTADEILVVRDEASEALPRLRDLFRRRLVEPAEETGLQVHEVVSELRSQVFEVESELKGLGLKKERNYRVGMTSLAASFVIYGLATQSPPIVATSLAALLATLGHLRVGEREHDAAQTKLVSSPSYVLMKARQILNSRT